jgi:ferredoxin
VTVPASAPATATVASDLCIGCGRCASVCPAGAIALNSERKATVDRSSCRGCGACVQICPTGAVRMSEPVGSGHPEQMTHDQGSMRTKHP